MPDPVWSEVLWSSEDQENPGVTCEARYESHGHRYEIACVRQKDGLRLARSVPALYEPRFGIDVSDLASIQEIAGELSDELKTYPPLSTQQEE